MDNSLERPTYFGIMPAEVRYARISASAKVFYAEISALCNLTGTCWASNQYFANLYGVQPTRISEWVKLLADAGLVTTKVNSGKQRSIRLTHVPNGDTLLENQKHPSGKPEHNNKSNNKNYIGDLGLQLLSLVNKITGRNFRTLPERGVKKTLDAFTLAEIESSLSRLVEDDWHKDKLKEFKIDYLIRATTIDKFLPDAEDNLTPDQKLERWKKSHEPN